MSDYLPKLEFQPYINPYVGSANNEFNELGKNLDVRYETNLAAMDELDMLMNNVNTLKRDTYLKDKLLADTRGQITQLREAGNWEDSRNKIRELARRFNNDNILKVAQANFEENKKIEAKISDNKMQGFNSIRYDNPNDWTTADPETGKPRSFIGDVERQLQYRPKQEEYFNDIQPDSIETKRGIYKHNGKNWEKINTDKETKEITNQKIINTAYRSIDAYLETPEGTQQKKILMQKEGKTSEQARQILRDELVATGKEKVFRNTGSSRDKTPFDGTSMGLVGEQPPLPNQPLEQSPYIKNYENPILKSLTEKLEVKGRKIGTNKGVDALMAPLYAGEKGGVGANLQYKTHVGIDILDDNEKKTISRIAQALNIKDNKGTYALKDLEKIRKYSIDNVNKTTSPAIRVYSEMKEAKEADDRIARNINRRMYYSEDEDKFYNFDQLPSDDQKALEAKSFTASGVYSNDNQFFDLAGRKNKNPDAWVTPESIRVNGKDLVVSEPLDAIKNSNFKELKMASLVSSGRRSGIPVGIKTSEGRQLVIPLDNGLYHIINKGGQSFTKEALTKEQIAKYILDNKYELEY